MPRPPDALRRWPRQRRERRASATGGEAGLPRGRCGLVSGPFGLGRDELRQPGPGLRRVLVRDALQDGQRLLPAVAGGRRITGVQLRVTQADGRAGLVDAVADLVEGLHRLGVALGGLLVIVHPAVRVAQAVPGVRLTGAMADLALELQRALAVGEGLLVLPEVGVQPADAVLDAGYGLVGADLPDHAQRLPRVHQGLGVPSLLLKQVTEALVHGRLVGPVPELAENVERLGQVRLGVGEVADVDQPAAQLVVRVPQADGVAQALGGPQRQALDADALMPPAAPVQERGQRPDQLPYRFVVAAGGNGVREQVEHDRALGVEPGQGLGPAGEFFRHRARLGRRQVDRLTNPVDLQRPGVRGMQVVGQAAAYGGGPLRLGVHRFRLLEGVGAEQIVEREPAWLVLGHHVGPGQLAQRGGRVRAGHPGQAGCRGDRDVRPRMQPEQPEHAGGRLAQLLIGPGQHRAYVGSRVTRIQGLEPVPGVAQLGGQRGE